MIIDRTRQRGVALIALLAVILLVGSFWLYKALNVSTASASVERSQRDSDVLQQAKTALIGQIALQAANINEANPGRLPCPESLSDAGKTNEGLPANATSAIPFGFCSGATVVGRLPWKALGLEKLQDSATEPLWYAVTSSWLIPNGTANTTINSDSPAAGGLTSTAGEDAVAVIFAPGQVLPGQTRLPINSASAALVPSNYLDLQNAALGAVFAKTGPADTFNDHVITITRAELMPEIEAAVADRFSRQIAPSIRTAYSSASWTASSLPFAGTFADPSTATFKGTATTQGLLPVSYATTGGACSTASPCACTGGGRCDPAFVSWQTAATLSGGGGGGGNLTSTTPTCSRATSWPYALNCSFGAYKLLTLTDPGVNFSIQVTADNVGNALRRINSAVTVTDDKGNSLTYTVSPAALNADGSATITLTSSIPPSGRLSLGAILGGLLCPLGAFCTNYTVSIPISLFSDHAIVEPDNTASDWFFRNNWHQLSYYAVSASAVPGQTGCTTGTNCLTVNNVSAAVNYSTATPYAANSVKSLVVFAGRQLTANAPVRPSASVTSYLEDSNATLTTTYAARSSALTFNRTFNDRVVVIDHN